MKEYRKKTDERTWLELSYIKNNFFDYLQQIEMDYITVVTNEYKMTNGEVLYFETETEKGIVTWGSDELDMVAYSIPDNINFEDGNISSSESFTVYKMVNLF